MKKYLISKCIIVYPSKVQDAMYINPPLTVDDKEQFRMKVQKEHPGCIRVNLTYSEVE